MNLAESIIAHISEVPWSNYKKSDYTLDQWHRACLIHQHKGPPTAQSQCKIPVKTPDGTLNRNGVKAAAAALAGARGGVDASAEEIASAKKAVARLYTQLNEDAPESLSHTEELDVILEHIGVPGMRWGFRKQRHDTGHVGEKVSGQKLRKLDQEWEGSSQQKLERNFKDRMKQEVIPKFYNNPKYKAAADSGQLRDPNSAIRKQHDAEMFQEMKKLLNDEASKAGMNPSGSREWQFRTTKRDGAECFEAHIVDVQHIDFSTLLFKVTRNPKGFVTDLEPIADSVEHAEELEAILGEMYHHGVKGMRWGFSKARENRVSRAQEITIDAARAKELKKQIRKKGVSSVSNEDLAALNKRLKLEETYSKWAEKNPTASKKAAKFIAQTLIQEATHEILGSTNPSPIGAIARNLQAQTYAARVKQAKAAGTPIPQRPGRHKGPRPNLTKFPPPQPGSGSGKKKKKK